MNWTEVIQKSIDYIEDNIGEKIDADIISEKLFVSSFYFQKMFATVCDCTVSEYIRNRRMSLAGNEILSTDTSILDIALKYDYETNESFSRAFMRFHGVTPLIARKSKASLKTFSKISVLKKLVGGKVIMGELSERGYIVKETGAVYYTKNLDKTLNWFMNVLGWYGQIDERDENNEGTYGCVDSIPVELQILHLAPFTGIHLMKGEPIKRMVGFMLVQGVEKLRQHVISSGWKEISEIVNEPWGGKICTVTTIDGSILRFFEL